MLGNSVTLVGVPEQKPEKEDNGRKHENHNYCSPYKGAQWPLPAFFIDWRVGTGVRFFDGFYRKPP
jgi:hypothetical protein